jgi:hypothetical protein
LGPSQITAILGDTPKRVERVDGSSPITDGFGELARPLQERLGTVELRQAVHPGSDVA